MPENYLINVYTGELYHRDDFRIVRLKEEELDTLSAMSLDYRKEFAANKGTRIPKEEQ